MRLRYLYTVDGGLVPKHHQPHSIEIFHDYDQNRVSIGHNEVFDSVDDAQNELLKRYDSVILSFIQTTSTNFIEQKLK